METEIGTDRIKHSRKISSPHEVLPLKKKSKRQLLEEISALQDQVTRLESDRSVRSDPAGADLFECQLKALINSRVYALKNQVRVINDPLELKRNIEASLQVLGELMQSERAFMFFISADGKMFGGAFEWVAPGFQRRPWQNLSLGPVARFPWSTHRLLSNLPVIVENTAELSEVAEPERLACAQLGIKSYVNIPMFYQGTYVGFLGFDSSVECCKWDEKLELVNIARDVLLNQLSSSSMRQVIESISLSISPTCSDPPSRMKVHSDFTGLYDTLAMTQSTDILYRMLVITSHPLIDEEGFPIDPLEISSERRSVNSGFLKSGLNIEISYLSEATAQKIESALTHGNSGKGYDIIHVSAHGDTSGLQLEDGVGSTHCMPWDIFLQLASKNFNLKILFLSACYTEYVGKILQNAFPEAQNNVSIVAIQGSIENSASQVFANAFYGEIGRQTVQQAFEYARREVANSKIVLEDFDMKVEDKDGRLPQDRFVLLGNRKLTFNRSLSAINLGIHTLYIPEYSFPTNLAETQGFVGRAEELAELIKLMHKANHPNTVVTGPPGIGKSEFLKTLGRWFYDRQHRSVVFWCSGSQLDPFHFSTLDELFDIFRSTFKLDFTKDNSIFEKSAIIRNFCERHSALILIDSWNEISKEQKINIWKFLGILPAATAVVISSCEHISPSFHHFELGTLDPKDARTLFWNTLKNGGFFSGRMSLSVSEAKLLSDIPTSLEGYPQALVTVATKARVLDLNQVAEGLKRDLKSMLQGFNDITGQPTAGIWVRLEEMYTTLSQRETDMLKFLSVISNQFYAEDLAGYLNLPAHEVTDPLDSIVKKCFVKRVSGSRPLFEQHVLIRKFMASKSLNPLQMHVKVIDYHMSKNTWKDLMRCDPHLYILATTFQQRNIAQQYLSNISLFVVDEFHLGNCTAIKLKLDQALDLAINYQDANAYQKIHQLFSMLPALDESALPDPDLILRKSIEISRDSEIQFILNTLAYFRYLQNLGDERDLGEISEKVKKVNAPSEEIADALTTLGYIQLQRGKKIEASEHLTKSLGILKRIKNELESSSTVDHT
eukprot:TRINITY_DN6279_c0_g1_i4.p1 TRINITY_DN6279_c0_g1~~TRINITY_DN6279_c0_g1_i4.p1  ORF type:complete len:1064 (+),score=298.02 TRINITY_DN6279_c0_g1_i4:148-3339(+)